MKSSILAIGLWVLTVDTASAQTFAVLKDFTGIDGNNPSGDLVLDGDTLYGTTWRNTGGPDAGRIFKVNTDGTDFAVLKSFEPAVWSGSAYTNSEGTYPYAGLTLSGGTLYGTAAGGGILGNGTLFLLDTNGSSFTVLESFTPGAWTDIQGISVWTNLDGANPVGSLVLSGGTLYGATAIGGNWGRGVVFKINTNGSDFSVLKSFPPAADSGFGYTNTDGANPAAGLVLSGSALYGTTRFGGSSGRGVIFRINTNGTGFLVLKNFFVNDGWEPQAGMVLSSSTLYGTTSHAGGPGSGNGTVFRMNTDGSDFTVLKGFATGGGAVPMGNLLLNGSTLYGTTSYGGSSGYGTVFKINTNGTGFTDFKDFLTLNGSKNTNSGGARPIAGLVLSGSTFYGTASQGGSSGYGTVFGLTVPPRILLNDINFGVQSNCFGFHVDGVFDQMVVIEASTNITASQWMPLQTNSLGPLYFCDPAWTNYPRRFYRARTQ